MKKRLFRIPVIVCMALLVSSACYAEEHLPLSGKSFTIGSGSATDWTHKYETLSFTGIPDKLSFNFAYIYTAQSNIGNPTLNFSSLSAFAQAILGIGGYSDERKGVGNTHMLYIEESANGTNWTTIWTNDDATDKNSHASGDIQLSKSTRYIRFHHSCNFSNSYTDIKVTELKYLEDPDPATIDFGAAIINSGEVTKTCLLNWCNIAPLSVSCSNPRFTVTPAGFGNVDTYGSQVLTVAYTHTGEAGSHEGDITVTNGTYTKTIHVSATTTKRQQTITWNSDLAATGFAMNINEQYPDEGQVPVLAKATGGGRITFTSEDESIIAVVADTALLAKGIGTVRITAYQAGDEEYQEVSDTKSFVVTPLQKQAILWDQNLYGLLTTSAPVTLTATATSGGEITYTSADESVVQINGNILTVVGEGETYITATQAGFTDGNGIEWLSVSQNNYVVVRNPASQCNGMALSQGSLTLNGSKKSQDYNLSGIPNMLTFTAKHGEKNTSTWGSSTYSALIVEQYAYINNLWDWYQVYNQVVGTSDTQSGNISLDETATKLRFRTLETGTDHTVSNIRVTRQKFMRSDVTAVDQVIETNAMWNQTITIGHSNIDQMTVTSKQQILTLSTSTLGEGCNDFGEDAFTVSFTPTVKYVDYYDTIVITDNKTVPTTIEIPVHLYAQGLHQVINDFVLPEACLTTATLDPFAATATSNLEVVYLSSDSTVAYVENNRLVILSAGTVAITAYQAGDERYESASDTKTIVISLTPTTVIEAPQAKPIAVGQPLADSKLIGGTASVDGSFAWLEPQTMPEAGEQTFAVLFTPTNSAIYATATTQVTLEVLYELPTTYGVYQASFCQGDSVEFAGKWYYTDTEEQPILVPEKNDLGGDSIVTFSAVVLPTYLIEEDTAIHMNEPFTWREKEYGAWTPGVYTLYDSLVSIHGCDSVYALELTVNAIPYLIQETGVACQNEQRVWHGKDLPTQAAGTFVLYDSLQSIYGTDSVYELTLTVYPAYALEDEAQTMYVGQAGEWREIDLSLLPVGDTVLTKAYTTVSGCDSVYTMHLTVNEAPTTYGKDTIYICGRGEVAFYDDVEYNKPNKKPVSVTLSTPNQFGGDSIVELWVLASNKYDMSFTKTIEEGTSETWQGIDLSVLPAGDTTLVVIYTTIHGCDSTYTLHLTVKAVQQTPTALDNTDGVDNQPCKFFRNGQMYIRKNGQVYNLQGIKVEER